MDRLNPNQFPLTQAESVKPIDFPGLPKTDLFYVAVFTCPGDMFSGFVLLERETMYSAWCEALRTLRLESYEYITITPFKHLPDVMQKYAKEATPREVIL